MNRCRWLGPAAWAVGVAVLLHAPAAPAQSVRPFPPQALRGVLEVTAPPNVLLNNQPQRLSPGARIRNPQNMLVLSGQLVGQPLVVNYTLESSGLVHEVWILTPEEIRQPRDGVQTLTNIVFESDRQRALDAQNPAAASGR